MTSYGFPALVGHYGAIRRLMMEGKIDGSRFYAMALNLIHQIE